MAIDESHINSAGIIESLQRNKMVKSHHHCFPVVGHQRHGPSSFGLRTSPAKPSLPSSVPNPISISIMDCTYNTFLSTASTLRGGAVASNVVLDMARESQHLAVLSSYGVVTVLVLNSA